MKRLPVIYSEDAVGDQLGIASYIFSRSENITTVERYMARLDTRCLKIGDAPFGGIAREDLGPGIRMAVFEKSVVILYVIEADAVLITNLFSGGRDYEALLRP